jgi:hypothetical protein
MRRVTEVIDTWFDSGSMPFAQWHYPFEHRDTVARSIPADFIAEGVDQTRGWFYSLLAIATGLGDALPNNTSGAAPYRAVVVNDLVLDASGQKMSKSARQRRRSVGRCWSATAPTRCGCSSWRRARCGRRAASTRTRFARRRGASFSRCATCTAASSRSTRTSGGRRRPAIRPWRRGRTRSLDPLAADAVEGEVDARSRASTRPPRQSG